MGPLRGLGKLAGLRRNATVAIDYDMIDEDDSQEQLKQGHRGAMQMYGTTLSESSDSHLDYDYEEQDIDDSIARLRQRQANIDANKAIARREAAERRAKLQALHQFLQ